MSHNRLDFDYVKQFFANNGCELLETEYKNAHIHLRYRCVCGNESTINFCNFKNGKRCKKCGKAKSNLLRRHSLDYVKSYFSERGCELLGEYKNALTPIPYRCSCGNVSKITFADFSIGKRCRICKYAKIAFKNSGENSPRWRVDRKQFFLEVRFKNKCRAILRHVLNYTNQEKNQTTEELLGYNWETLKKHIEQHPNYSIVENGVWHIDHIFPIKAFIDYGIWDVKIINSLDNLQPLTAEANCAKSDTYIKEEFINYLKEKGAC